MRTKGALNKPKFILVTMQDIASVFNKNATIRIDSSYQILFDKAPPASAAPVAAKPVEEEDSIEMTVV